MYGGFILHHHTCVFPWRRRSAFLLAMAVSVLEPNTAVVSPTSIPLREVLVLPDAETHITHRQQQHTPSRAQIINTKCTAYACVICQKLFFPARVEMYCTVHTHTHTLTLTQGYVSSVLQSSSGERPSSGVSSMSSSISSRGQFLFHSLTLTLTHTNYSTVHVLYSICTYGREKSHTRHTSNTHTEPATSIT